MGRFATRISAAHDKRELSLEPGMDGTSWLTAHLASATAEAIDNRVTDVATHLPSAIEPRTLTPVRADVFGELLIDGVVPADHPRLPDLGRVIRARVLITVPVRTRLGHRANGTRAEGTRFDGPDTEPAILEKYGTIDIETAPMVAADTPGFAQILTHPESGTVLSLGRDRYAIPPGLRVWLRMRDEICRAPSCGSPARRRGLDHTQDRRNGSQSDHKNPAHLCPKHHDDKHRTRWRVEHAGEGDPEEHLPGMTARYPNNAATTTRTGIDPIVMMSTVSRAMISPRL